MHELFYLLRTIGIRNWVPFRRVGGCFGHARRGSGKNEAEKSSHPQGEAILWEAALEAGTSDNCIQA